MAKKKIALSIESDKNANVSGQSLNVENIIPALHEALDKYEVPVWNGSSELTLKPLKDAITYMSSDIRSVKDNSAVTSENVTKLSDILTEHKELLQNIKDRKKLKEAALSGFKNVYGYMNTHSWFKAFMFVLLNISALYGIIRFLEYLFSFTLIS